MLKQIREFALSFTFYGRYEIQEHFKNKYPVPFQIKTGGSVFLYSEFSEEIDKNRLYIFCRYLEQRESIEEGGVSWAELTSILPALPLLCFFARRTSKEHQLSFLPFFASLPPPDLRFVKKIYTTGFLGQKFYTPGVCTFSQKELALMH